MGMNAKFKVDSHFFNVKPFIHFSFFKEVVVLKFYLAKYQKSMTHENFRVHTYYERHRFNPSGHRGNIYHKLQG